MTEQTTPTPEAQPIPLPADAPVYRPGEDEAEDAAWIDGWNEGYRRGYDTARVSAPRRQAALEAFSTAWTAAARDDAQRPAFEALATPACHRVGAASATRSRPPRVSSPVLHMPTLSCSLLHVSGAREEPSTPTEGTRPWTSRSWTAPRPLRA